MPSNYAIEARDEFDIAAGVRFANKHNLRLVVKGTGKSRNRHNNVLFELHICRPYLGC